MCAVDPLPKDACPPGQSSFGRIAFLVDAAIFGFAVGTGFSIVENTYYSFLVGPDTGIGTWIIRGLSIALALVGARLLWKALGPAAGG